MSHKFGSIFAIVEILVIVIILICIGTHHITDDDLDISNGIITYSEDDNFIKVPDNKDLYYRKDTKIIYIIFYRGYIAPYYSENGKLVRYEDNKLQEVDAFTEEVLDTEDEVFDNEQDAENRACECSGAYAEGAEVLELAGRDFANPDDVNFIVTEVN